MSSSKKTAKTKKTKKTSKISKSKKDEVKYPTEKEIAKLTKVEKYKDRPSPPYHAADAPNWVILGNDKYYYISRKNKSGIYQWKRLKQTEDENLTKSAYEYYSQFKDYKPLYDIKPFIKNIKKVKKDLEKHKIFLVPIGWSKVWDFIDYAWDDAQEYVEKKTKTGHFDVLETHSFLLYTDHRLFWAIHKDGEVTIQHNILKKDREFIIETFKKYFGKSYSWNGSDRKTITIKLKKL